MQHGLRANKGCREYCDREICNSIGLIMEKMTCIVYSITEVAFALQKNFVFIYLKMKTLFFIRSYLMCLPLLSV